MTDLAKVQQLINDMAMGLIKIERISLAMGIIRETEGLPQDKVEKVFQATAELIESVELKH